MSPNARFRSSDPHRRSTGLALTGALALSFWSSIGWTEPNAETQEPPSVTDSASRSARDHYHAGRKAYDRGEYEASRLVGAVSFEIVDGTMEPGAASTTSMGVVGAPRRLQADAWGAPAAKPTGRAAT